MATDSEDCLSQIGHRTIPVLSNVNYQSWKDRLESLLQLTGCKKFIVEPEPVLPEDATEADKDRFETKRDRALGLMKTYMDSSQVAILNGIESPLKAWHKIRDTYCPKSRARIAELRREFILLKPEEGEHIGVFIARVRKIVKDLGDAGKIVDDSEIAFQLIAFLPETYENIVAKLYALEDKKFTSAEVETELLTEYGRLESKKKLEELCQQDKTFLLQGTKRKELNSLKKQNRQSEQKIVCYRCKNTGHIARNCKFNLSNEQKQRRFGNYKKSEKSQSQKQSLFYVSEMETAQEADVEENRDIFTWDSAATCHVLKSKNFFKSYKPLDKVFIKFGPHPTEVIGMGDAVVNVYSNKVSHVITLKNALHVPSAQRNLISGKKMDDAGFTFRGGHGIIKFYYPDGAPFITAKKEKNFFIFHGVNSKTYY